MGSLIVTMGFGELQPAEVNLNCDLDIEVSANPIDVAVEATSVLDVEVDVCDS